MNFFKPEDFALISGFRSGKDTADAANKLLSERGVRVYGQGISPMKSAMWCMNGPDKDFQHTHQALLINIEELPKPECAHKGYQSNEGHHFPIYNCSGCGIALKASWSPA